MNLIQIRYFVSVADNMSFTQAAKKLYISQPSISKQVAALEDELGIKLFRRTGKAPQLTSAGELLYHDFKLLMNNIELLIQRAHDIGSSTVGQLKIGITRDMDIPKVTGSALLNFSNAWPNIKIEFVTGLGEDLKQLCIDDKLDCMFMLSYKAEELSGYTPLDSLTIYQAPVRMIYRKDFFPDGRTPTVSDLNSQTFIIIAESEKNVEMAPSALTQIVNVGITPRNIIWADSVDSLLLNVHCRFGIGIIGPTARLTNSEELACINLPNAKELVGITLCWKTTNKNKALLSFVDYMRKIPETV
jgi:DNA-binding transcriptional LysR family regulator